MLRILLVSIFILIFSAVCLSQSNRQIQGIWRSYNRLDTLTVAVSDTLIYFNGKSIVALNENVFRFWAFNIDGQLILELQPAGSSQDLKLLLWIVTPREIKQQEIG